MRKAALQFNIVDRPDGRLKNQRSPVPYLGGLAVYLAFLISLSLTFSFDQEMLGILLGGTIIVILGLIDDFGVLSPVVKLCGQSIAVLVLMRSGIIIQLDIIPWYISLPLSYVWLIGIINAFNIIDVMDGLSSGVALMCSIIFILVGVINHKHDHCYYGRPPWAAACWDFCDIILNPPKFTWVIPGACSSG